MRPSERAPAHMQKFHLKRSFQDPALARRKISTVLYTASQIRTALTIVAVRSSNFSSSPMKLKLWGPT